MIRFLLLIMSLILTVSILGCETIKGLGKDIENTGQNIGEAINKIENP